jgi:hypothetical protein
MLQLVKHFLDLCYAWSVMPKDGFSDLLWIVLQGAGAVRHAPEAEK